MAWEKVTFVVGLPKEMLGKSMRENYREVLYVATKNIDKVSEIPQWLATKVKKTFWTERQGHWLTNSRKKISSYT